MIQLKKSQLLFASLVGSEVTKSIPRFAAIENELGKHVLPPIPFLPYQNEMRVISGGNGISGEEWKADKPNIEGQFFPLKFRRRDVPGEPWYTFPYEPLISIEGQNEIVKRSVAKNVNIIGTIKERWSQGDYNIKITGIFMGEDMIGSAQMCYPRSDFEKLRDYCSHPQGLEVLCEPLQLLGINYLVIEKFSFPFTKGENVQAYEVNALSDFTSDFLLEIEA